MLEIKKYIYSCDGGGVTLANSRGPKIRLRNDLGDGDYTLYIMKASGWGPAHYADPKEYEKYENFIEDGWEDIGISIYTDKQNDGIWKAMFYDLDDYEEDGIELEDGFCYFYRRVVKTGECGEVIYHHGDCLWEETEEVLDSQILIVIYKM